ncbi:hypothetical protein [Photobacterium profundum]|uniref:Uncharacterized protein n=1 Tax=Photobacterium profundum (strain SS9) TaxID=298386 RepID=Q6LRQ0_PHOPR|nr:hypothetical protein [Photobacterium profundum]CAG20026.1 Hypothetical protein PBPRA1615 [Photobacterium profundum SS9]
MGKLIETRFIVDEASIKSEFGYCWLTKADVKQLYILNLAGNFEIGAEKKVGHVCIQSKEDFDIIELDELDDQSLIRKQFNLGKIELRPKEPSVFIEITSSYLKHIWELCSSKKHVVSITFTTEDSVLQVREIASILVEIEKREATKKRGFFG